jgi:hypothetical protein
VTAGYYHRSFYNIQYTKNTLVDPVADYIPFNITVPQNPRLPNGGGQVITMYNLNPGQGERRQQRADVVREQHARVQRRRVQRERAARQGLRVRRRDHRADRDRQLHRSDEFERQQPRFCNNTPPFQTLYKTSAAYTFPYELNASMTFQARPGISIGSSYTFNSALAGVAITGGGNLTVTVVDPTTQYYDYVKTVDAQISRTFRFGPRGSSLSSRSSTCRTSPRS